MNGIKNAWQYFGVREWVVEGEKNTDDHLEPRERIKREVRNIAKFFDMGILNSFNLF